MFRHFGGKGKQAPGIVRLLEEVPHDRYVESYGGAASVLMRKARVRAEIVNDIDGAINATYRVLRNSVLARKLEFMLLLTPYSREEFEACWDAAPNDDMVEVARKVIVRGAMSFGTGHLDGKSARGTGFRDFSGDGRTLPAHDFSTYPDAIAHFTERLSRVIVDCRDGVDLMIRHDGPNTLHYVDPPYVPETRGMRRGYHCDMTVEDHARLLTCLRGLRGHVVVSGYRTELYDDALDGWERVEREFSDQGRRRRVECLWMSPSVSRARGQMSMALA